MVPSGAKAPVRIVFAPLSVLTRPAASTALPPGKSWLFADFSNSTQLSRNFPEFIAQVESANPGLILSQLSWGGTAAALAAHNIVRGQTAARYDISVDLDSAQRHAAGPAKVAFALALNAEIKEMGGPAASGRATHAVIAHAWINQVGQIIRIELAPAAGLGTMTVTLTDFGANVGIESPPSNQVVAVASLGPSGERENNNGGDSDGG